jgi:hypothetical protein
MRFNRTGDQQACRLLVRKYQFLAATRLLRIRMIVKGLAWFMAGDRPAVVSQRRRYL